MKKNRKITLIVILSSVLLLSFLIFFIFQYEDDTYKEIKMILSKIERSNDYLYYNDEHFYYKGNDYFFDNEIYYNIKPINKKSTKCAFLLTSMTIFIFLTRTTPA